MKPNDEAGNLTAEMLRQMLCYEPETGKFFWLRSNNQCKIGDEAGSKRRDRYTIITCCGRHYLAHRLAWFWVTGEWPQYRIDHKNMTRADNRWSNLRLASDSDNKANGRVYRNNFIGVKGVRLHECGKYVARISKNGKTRYLGVFESLDKAKEAYAIAARELFGDFARL